MPPKSKGSSKKPPKAKTPTLIDGLTKEEMTKEQLDEHIVRLREELDRENEERNYFQLERDKIHMFWEITERQKEEAKAELKNLEKDIEEDESRHQVELKVYRQKMKHLLCEHQNTISELRADAVVSTEAIQEEQQQLESALHEEMLTIKEEMQALDNESLYNELCLKHDKDMTERRNRVEEQLKRTEAKNKRGMEQLIQKLENGQRKEIGEREDQWKSYINTLKDDHYKAVEKIQTHKYEPDLNVSLKTDTEDNSEAQTVEDTDLDCLQHQDNKHLSELLSEVQEEIATLEKYRKLPIPKKIDTEKVTLEELNGLKQKQEALEQKLSKLQLERDELYEAFTQSVQEVQQKVALRGEQLDRKVSAMEERLENRQVQLDSVLSASNVDQTALRGVINRMEKNLDSTVNP